MAGFSFGGVVGNPGEKGMKGMLQNTNWVKLLLDIGVAELTGILSAAATGSFRSQYAQLNRPPLSPPGILFPIVWAVLYALMGIAAYKISQSDAGEAAKRQAQRVYALQLLVNFSWSIVYFRFGLTGLGALVIAVLLGLVIYLCTLYYKIDKTAAYLLLPYILWLAFALYLNLGTAILN